MGESSKIGCAAQALRLAAPVQKLDAEEGNSLSWAVSCVERWWQAAGSPAGSSLQGGAATQIPSQEQQCPRPERTDGPQVTMDEGERKGSIMTTITKWQSSEPKIIVDESSIEDNGGSSGRTSGNESSNEETPPTSMNAFLLNPWRDAREGRKHSLPTPQCSGITASQVRRLSERGENTAPGPNQTQFLATLSSAPEQTPGNAGRRHSVVTISKVPTCIFGKMRRESVGGLPSYSRILPARRNSSVGPPSTEARGSTHNLQLDIMDDIVQARKVRMKLWNTSSEKVCEVEPLDEDSSAPSTSSVVQKYTSASRRFSEFVGTTLAPIPSSSKRRASVNPQTKTRSVSSSNKSKQTNTGIVCSNTDLVSILSFLTSSSMEINQSETTKLDVRAPEKKNTELKTNRSNSFDVSILHGLGLKRDQPENKLAEPAAGPSQWFTKRHQPMSVKTKSPETSHPKLIIPKVTFTLPVERERVKEPPAAKPKLKPKSKARVLWDGRSGSLVDAHAIGNAIEHFLRRDSGEPGASDGGTKANKSKSGWFSGSKSIAAQACESSICATLKDMFK